MDEADDKLLNLQEENSNLDLFQGLEEDDDFTSFLSTISLEEKRVNTSLTMSKRTFSTPILKTNTFSSRKRKLEEEEDHSQQPEEHLLPLQSDNKSKQRSARRLKRSRSEPTIVGPKKSTQKKKDGQKPPTSKYRGVSKCSNDNKWQARIRTGRVVRYLGRFSNEEAAARRYDRAAKELHKERAVFNFPEEQQ